MSYWEAAESKDKEQFHRRVEAEKERVTHAIGSSQRDDSGEEHNLERFGDAGAEKLESKQEEVGLRLTSTFYTSILFSFVV